MSRQRMRLFGLAGLMGCVLYGACGSAGAAVSVKRTEQYGHERLEFRTRGHRAFVLLPRKRPAKGPVPWAWYAPVLRHKYPNAWHDWYFSHLLDAGIAVAGIDVGETWGNPKGRGEFTRFHALVTKEFSLAPKVCMLAETRGALMVFNWAVEQPQLVQCIGGLYPVCKITDGPFFARMYQLASDDKKSLAELRKRFKEHNPMDRLAPLAQAKVPLLLMHGTEDKVVPAQFHSVELARRYKKLGGPVRLILRKGERHSPTRMFLQSEQMLHFLRSGGEFPPPKTPKPDKKKGPDEKDDGKNDKAKAADAVKTE